MADQDATKIVVRENGPYLIHCNDLTLIAASGKDIPFNRQPVALCRCGASERKPFCDGAHNRIAFDGALTD